MEKEMGSSSARSDRGGQVAPMGEYAPFWALAVGLGLVAGFGVELGYFGEIIARMLYVLSGLCGGIWWCRGRA